MLTPLDMARRVLEELGDAATVHVSPALQASLQLPSTVELVTDLAAPVDLALIGAERVDADGGVVGDPVPAHARRVVAVLSSTSPGVLGARGAEAPPGPRADRIVTPLAVVDRVPEGLRVREVAEGISAADVQRGSDAVLLAGPDLAVIGAAPRPND